MIGKGLAADENQKMIRTIKFTVPLAKLAAGDS